MIPEKAKKTKYHILIKALADPLKYYEVEELFSWQTTLLEDRCKLQKEYYQAREKLRIPKDKDYTDFDRNTILQASCADIQAEYEFVKGLEEIVSQRINFIGSMKYADSKC